MCLLNELVFIAVLGEGGERRWREKKKQKKIKNKK